MSTCRNCGGIGYIGDVSSGVEGGHPCGACGGTGRISNSYSTEYARPTKKRKKPSKPLPKPVVIASTIIGILCFLFLDFINSELGVSNRVPIAYMLIASVFVGGVAALVLNIVFAVFKLFPQSKNTTPKKRVGEVMLLVVIGIIAILLIF
ncbi:hypothetical protein RS130_07970 [Paraglaciecola aquimarina]|uniref:Molecular chaperone DnaJ n=1 Tax=Paraglaciecola aquimarina TaxID=1235557 RepID=A0ABU3SV53_9ALTE|nr:hypothetical protein [Paraglaciecola aquimarina]MDU0353872.1 hypothetical protein [Paraglaciecola aquimarina]